MVRPMGKDVARKLLLGRMSMITNRRQCRFGVKLLCLCKAMLVVLYSMQMRRTGSNVIYNRLY
jgi:hypothetical protein